jgi:hypothetical protein
MITECGRRIGTRNGGRRTKWRSARCKCTLRRIAHNTCTNGVSNQVLRLSRPSLARVDGFAGSHWNAVGGTGSGCRSSAVFSALGRTADAQKRVPTTNSLHLRGRGMRVSGPGTACDKWRGTISRHWKAPCASICELFVKKISVITRRRGAIEHPRLSC